MFQIFLANILGTIKAKRITAVTLTAWLRPTWPCWITQNSYQRSSFKSWSISPYVSYLIAFSHSGQRLDTGISVFIASERHWGCCGCQRVPAYRLLVPVFQWAKPFLLCSYLVLMASGYLFKYHVELLSVRVFYSFFGSCHN